MIETRSRPNGAAWAGAALAGMLGACAPHGDGHTAGARAGHPLLSAMASEGRGPAAAAGAGRSGILGADASPITFERMSRYPEPGWQIPRSIAYSPDSKLVTFLQSEGQSDEMALWSFDRATRRTQVLLRAAEVLKQDKPLSREEELRRERQRQRIQGVTGYVWAKRAPVMVLPLGGDIFVRTDAGVVKRLTDTKEPELDPKPCETGERVAFVRGSELFVVEVATGKETALTRNAPAGVTRGQSDFNGQEEFGESSGFFWAPGCDRIAYLEVDERAVAELPVVGYREGKPDVMMQRYPRAGAKNPQVRAGVIDLASRRTAWIRFAKEPAAERYLGRFLWARDGKALWLQALSRDQKRHELWRVDPQTGAAAEIVSETSPAWVDMAPMELLEKTPRLLWVGGGAHRHLEVRDAATGAKVAALTSGDWDVEAIEGVDEERGRVLVRGTKEGPLERHIYAVKLDGGGEPTRLTPEAGVHDVVVDREGRDFVDVHSAVDRPPQTAIRAADGKVLGEIATKLDPDLATLRARPVEFVTVRGPSGEALHGALLRPRDLVAGRRYPAVVVVYGGPGVQTVLNAWSTRLLWQHLADRGVVVFQLDNHGSAGRGPAFETPIHRKLGTVELADQLAGVDYLASLPFVDKDRLGIYGHSYGGFMAALAMLKAPGRFKVGIAGSPVTDWRLYDTGYTERYMETPATNPEGYAQSDLSKLAGNLRGKLLLVHAMMDENVHFENTAQLVDAFTRANRPFDLIVLPGERHGYRGPAARQYVFRRVTDYFAEHL